MKIIWILLLSGIHALAMKYDSEDKLVFVSRSYQNDKVEMTNDNSVNLELQIKRNLKDNWFRAKIDGGIQWFSDENYDLDLKQAWLGAKKSFFYFKAGYQLYDWGGMEVFKPFHALNSYDYRKDFPVPSLMGLPSLSMNLRGSKTRFEFVISPFAAFPKYGNVKSRVNFVGLNYGKDHWIDHKGYVVDNGRRLQGGMRFQQYHSDLHYSLIFTSHFDKNMAWFTPSSDMSSIETYYFRAYQSGISIHYFISDITVKMEAGLLYFPENEVATNFGEIEASQKSHGMGNAGLEYNLVHSNGSNTRFLLELQRLGTWKKFREEDLSIFQADVFVGVKHNLKYIDGGEIELGTIYDYMKRDEGIVIASYSQRIFEIIRLKVAGSLIFAAKKNTSVNGLEPLRNNDFISTKVTTVF